MDYRRSPVLERWHRQRRADIAILEAAHARASRDPARPAGPGRPRKQGGQQLGEALVLRVYAGFQGFARDLHDLAAQAAVFGAGADPGYRALLVTAITRDRRLDTGNAGLRDVARDFRRLGLEGLNETVRKRYAARFRTDGDQRYDADTKRYGEFTELRNAVAHANDRQLRALHGREVRPTRTYVIRTVLPALDRRARAMDEAVWDHVIGTFDIADPWDPR